MPGEFPCNNSGCISIEDICNGVDDCMDGSDETDDICKQDILYCYLIHTLFNIHDEIKPIRSSDIKIQAMH